MPVTTPGGVPAGPIPLPRSDDDASRDGDLDGRTAGEPLMALIEGVLREHGYSVARNDPFKGVEIIARNGRPAEKRHSLQIEAKRSCYADVKRHEPNAGFARVQRALDAMMAALAVHVRARCGRPA